MIYELRARLITAEVDCYMVYKSTHDLCILKMQQLEKLGYICYLKQITKD